MIVEIFDDHFWNIINRFAAPETDRKSVLLGSFNQPSFDGGWKKLINQTNFKLHGLTFGYYTKKKGAPQIIIFRSTLMFM